MILLLGSLLSLPIGIIPEGLRCAAETTAAAVQNEDENAGKEVTDIKISGMIVTNGSQISYYLEEDGTVSIVGCGRDMTGKVEIPAVIEEKTVKKIAEGAFYNCETLECVILPDSVTVIEPGAFHGCKKLSSVEIPDTVTEIGESAFYGCEALTKLRFPEKITVIPESCCSGCISLTEIQFPSSLRSIGKEAFYSACGTEQLEIPDGVTDIGEKAFYYWPRLKTVSFPASLSALGDFVFDGCDVLEAIQVSDENKSFCDENGILYTKDMTKLIKYPPCQPATEFIVPDSVKELAAWSFIGAENLRTISLSNVEKFGEDTFYYCTNLEAITIPEAMKEIPEAAFAYCHSLTNVVIPEDCTGIGAYAFLDCTGIRALTVPKSVEKIGEYAMGYGYDLESESLTILEDFKLDVWRGSMGAAYAKANELEYRSHSYLWLIFLIAGVVCGGIAAAAAIIHKKQSEIHVSSWNPRQKSS